MKDTIHSDIHACLQSLEQALTAADLWSDNPPTAEQLASREPFCVDTMPFEAWLQWLFIPKMRELLAMPHFNGMPNRSDIHTMVDYVFQSYDEDTDAVVVLIKKIDQLLNTLSA